METKTSTSAAKKSTDQELANVKVLMIEDDAFFTDVVLTKLSAHGCMPYSTASGAEALTLAAEHKPDVIVLDLMLPAISGEEVLQQLKADSNLSKIPVIVFSNKSGQADIESNLKAGASEYLVKSATDFNTLIDVVKGAAMKAKQPNH